MNWVKNMFLRSGSTPAKDPADLYSVRPWEPTEEEIKVTRSMPTLQGERKAAISRASAAGQVVDVVYNGEVVERWIPPGVPVDPRQTVVVGPLRERVAYGGRRSGKTMRARIGQP